MTLGAHRKVVTVLFCDVVGSTALGESVDPETLQAILARYFERLKAIVEAHGGAVDKFIGDAVMAVFGVPVAHDDDALRACRAAVEMRAALPELGVEGRIGVNTGEVLAGTDERLVTGDAVNVAARLEQAAQPGQVLIGAETLAHVEPVVEVGEELRLELKGKREPVSAFPLTAVREVAERSHAFPFVGRRHELEQLAEGWARALARTSCELVTVVGEPGIGKSRLVAETLAQINAPVVRGRCLPYGEGITYWPIVEVVKQVAEVPRDPAAAAAVRSLLGETKAVAGTDEIAWAFRKLLEEQAPLVVCFDDIQWAEETFLELVESIPLLSEGAALLVLCMARPELLDRRPGWAGVLRLQPLPEEEASALVGDAVRDDVRRRIVSAAGGNPLFLTEMVALSRGRVAEVEVPETVRAVLAARLDQLDQSERRVLECGAVEGELFHRGIVHALAPEETELTSRLAALVRRELIRPQRPVFPHEDAYRFNHLLIRDATYEALPKATRADLHHRLAAWLEEHGDTLVELDEVLGYHLEQSAGYLAELHRPDPELALAAGGRLSAAGRRAYWRGDWRAAIGLIDRALPLTRPHRFDLRLELLLVDALRWTDVPRAIAVADDAATRAEATGDETGAALARTVATALRMESGQSSPDDVERLAQAVLPRLQSDGDDEGLAQVWYALASRANYRGRFGDFTQAMESALRHAQRAGQPVLGPFTAWLGVGLIWGPQPASEALSTLDAVLADQPYPPTLVARALLLAMLDRIDDAWALTLPAQERARELGFPAWAVVAEIALVAGDYEAQAEYWQKTSDVYEASGDLAGVRQAASRLGRVLCVLGRYEEAEPLIKRGRELEATEDIGDQAAWRQAQALLESARGRHGEAERLAREAVMFLSRGDSLFGQGMVLSNLAEVLEAAGRHEEAIVAWHEALDRYERKQIIPLARRVRERLAATARLGADFA